MINFENPHGNPKAQRAVIASCYAAYGVLGAVLIHAAIANDAANPGMGVAIYVLTGIAGAVWVRKRKLF